MKRFPKTFRAPDQRVAILQMILGGHEADLPPEQIAAALPEASEAALPHMLGMAEAATALGCEVGPLGVSAEFILAVQQPIIVLIRLLPDDTPYPIIIWNKVGPFYQILDPRVGQRWVSQHGLLSELNREPIAWEADHCQQALQHETQTAFLRQRLAKLKITDATTTTLLEAATNSLQALSHLHGGLRLVEEMVADGLKRGREAEEWLHYFLTAEDELATIPETHRLIQEILGQEVLGQEAANEPDQVIFQGILAIPILNCVAHSSVEEQEEELSEEAEEAPPQKPQQQGVFALMMQYLREEGMFHPAIVVTAIAVSAAGLVLEAILLRGLMEIGLQLDTSDQRQTAIFLVLGFMFLIFVTSWGLQDQAKRIGRRFDMRLRQAAFRVAPRLSDQYFQRLAPADIVDRVHNLQSVPKLATKAYTFLSRAIRLLLVTLGIAWIDWPLALINYVVIYVSLVLFMNGLRSLYQDAYRDQTINGRLSVLYVDGVRGRSAIWSHGAEQASRYEYEQVLTQYGRAFLTRRLHFLLLFVMLQLPIVISPVIQLLVYTARGGTAVNLLLLYYWILELNKLMGAVTEDVQSVMTNLAHATRFGDVLQTTPEADMLKPADETTETLPYISMIDINIHMGEQPILKDINVTINKGEHVAVIGTSGAGKSTLVSVLLGRHYASSGSVYVDGKPLDYGHLQQLRRKTAWVDPNMQLWDESLRRNLQYGTPRGGELSNLLHTSIRQADLLSVLERMPEGLASSLGQGGHRVSGGEGQRIRFGRGLHRQTAELVILDEAFRGIDREKRSTLLAHARDYWADSTLICVTHDVSHTLSFERVLVLDEGRIVEDDHPQTLVKQDSRYRTLLEEEEQVRVKLWENESWRHLHLAAGELSETATAA